MPPTSLRSLNHSPGAVTESPAVTTLAHQALCRCRATRTRPVMWLQYLERACADGAESLAPLGEDLCGVSISLPCIQMELTLNQSQFVLDHI